MLSGLFLLLIGKIRYVFKNKKITVKILNLLLLFNKRYWALNTNKWNDKKVTQSGNLKILIQNFQVNKTLVKMKLVKRSQIKQQKIVMVNFYTFLHQEKSKWLLNVHEKNFLWTWWAINFQILACSYFFILLLFFKYSELEINRN